MCAGKINLFFFQGKKDTEIRVIFFNVKLTSLEATIRSWLRISCKRKPHCLSPFLVG